MDSKKMVQQGGYGRLPANAPLANPYVPFQLEDPPKYEPRTAIIKGTLFPGLDLPFMDMVNEKELPVTPRSELQVLGFALHELALYLDTHRNDQEALEVYRAYQDIYHKAMMEYEKMYGAMAHGMPSDRNSYGWLDDPWPWEYARNREV